MDRFIGNINSPIWFLGENPSLTQMNKQLKCNISHQNLQWNASAGDALLRKSITEAGLKNGDPNLNEGWNCCITNVTKEPEIVIERNKKNKILDTGKNKQKYGYLFYKCKLVLVIQEF